MVSFGVALVFGARKALATLVADLGFLFHDRR